MKIITTPKSYAPIYAPVIYTIDESDPNKVIEVVIMGFRDKMLGIKHFRGEMRYAVNVGGYASKELKVQPTYAQNTGFYTLSNRTAVVRIGASSPPPSPQSTSTETVILVAASEETPEMTQLAKERKTTTIAEGDIDEISFIAPQKLVAAVVTLAGKGGVKKIAIAEQAAGGLGELTPYRCGSGVCALIVNVEDVAKLAGVPNLIGYSRMSVEVKVMPSSEIVNPIDLEAIENGISTVAKREYIITTPDPKRVRLCWLNRQAGVDYYSFGGERAQTVVVDKSRAYTSQGYNTYSSEVETIEMLRSQYEPDQTIEWLSGIIGASKVWRAEGAQYTPIDIISSSVQTKSSRPISMNITVRESTKKSLK